MIPRRVFFIWLGSPIPGWAAENVRRFRSLNPKFEVSVCGDDEDLPMTWRQRCQTLRGKYALCQQADLIRVWLLLTHGGWYFDTDFVFLRPMDELYDEFSGFPRDAFLTRHKGRLNLIANGVIGAEADSSLLLALRQELEHTIERHSPPEWGDFGPALYTNLIARQPGLAHIADTPLFYPYPDKIKEAKRAANAIYESDYAPEVVSENAPGNPYALHFSMQGDLTL